MTDRITCKVCDKPAAFWLDLGDFVAGWTTTRIPVCPEHLEELMSKCMYESKRWETKMRYIPVTANEDIYGDVQKEMAEKEWKRIDKEGCE